MAEKMLVPSIEQRLAGMLEVTRRMKDDAEGGKRLKPKPAVTISREFGCEAYPMAERLKELLERKSGEPWVIMDKALLEETAKLHNISEEVFRTLGHRPRFLDEMVSTLTPRWKSEKDHYRLLCDQIVSLASAGNVILIGRGSSIITQQLENCYHFRIYASHQFKVRSIARRVNIPPQEADHLIERKQKERDRFIRDFLDCDARDLSFYHLAINNDRSPAPKIAQIITDYIYLKPQE
ncbi:MAG: cytidylate kinase-like family protein [Desulfuromonadales bacterium]|nr:MAG: cytidylate kinase-like family protein [Desulfuromonadales bacterium]